MELDGDVDSIRTSVRRPVGRKVIRRLHSGEWRLRSIKQEKPPKNLVDHSIFITTSIREQGIPNRAKCTTIFNIMDISRVLEILLLTPCQEKSELP